MTPKIKKLLKILAFAIVGIIVLFYASIYYIFSGGISGIVSSLKPAPNHDSPNLTEKRIAIENDINTSFSNIENVFELNHYETAIHDRCYKGTHSYKRSDGYAYKCTYRITKFYGLDGDLLENAIAFEQKITDLGWIPPVYEDPYPLKKLTDYIKNIGISFKKLHDGLKSDYENFYRDNIK